MASLVSVRSHPICCARTDRPVPRERSFKPKGRDLTETSGAFGRDFTPPFRGDSTFCPPFRTVGCCSGVVTIIAY